MTTLPLGLLHFFLKTPTSLIRILEFLQSLSILITSNVMRRPYEFRQELLDNLTKDSKVIVLGSKSKHIDDLLGLAFEVLERHGTNPPVKLNLVFKYKRFSSKRNQMSC